ncbi:hypothetical protein V1505DRAFT_359231, partial [Lipomyces doorenjongii]
MHAYPFLLFPSFSNITKRKGPCAGKPTVESSLRVKGNKKAKKEDVVVAYGAGQFGSTMKGKRAAP